MSRKLLPADFIDIIAQNQGITKKKSEAFIRAFFEVIEEGLRNDSFVKIKGFGTFKLVSVSERESVNINTGERFQISGHTKISFLPDSSFKELINRPFSHFETIVIPDSTTLEEIEAISESVADEQEDADFIESQTEETPIPTSALEGITIPQSAPAEEPVHASAPVQEESYEAVKPAQVKATPEVEEEQKIEAETQEIEATTSPEEAEPRNYEEDVKEVEPIATTEVIDENEIVIDMSSLVSQNSEFTSITTEEIAPAEVKTEATKDCTDDTTHIEEDCNQKTPSEDPEVLAESTEIQANDTDAIDNNSTSNTSSEDIEMSTSNTTKTSRWLFIGFVWILTIVLSYLAGYHRLIPLDANYHNNQEVSQNDTLQQAPTDTLPTPVDTVATFNPKSLLPAGSDTLPVIRGIDRATANKLCEKFTQVSPGSFLIIGTYGTHTLRKGDSLFKIAKSTYGHRDYAKYIIHYNNFTYPYNVPLGTEILLPQLVEKEECADSAQVVKKKKTKPTVSASTTTEKSEHITTPSATTESPATTENKTEN